jgi:hypothetical protein
MISTLLGLRINTKGISFDYHGDRMVYVFPWSRIQKDAKYFSTTHSQTFDTLIDYWTYIGALQKGIRTGKKIQGYSYQEVFIRWMKVYYSLGEWIMLFDVNYEAKPKQFWESLPQGSRVEMLKDIVVLQCNGIKEVIRVCENVPSNFALALGFSDGEIISDNSEGVLIETISRQNEKVLDSRT